jgi:ribosomal protein S18 acetylase RimI-like enzyme
MTLLFYSDANSISASQLTGGFFEGWPSPPSSEMHLKLLQKSSHCLCALDDESQQVVGFITAISDGTLSAYIPFLEVLPKYRKNGIATELVKRMRDTLSHLYMIDLCCDPELVPFYERFGMKASTAMISRNYSKQSGS